MTGSDGTHAGPSPAVREPYAYHGAVTERPTAQLWDLVQSVGPVEARDRIVRGQVGSALLDQTEARRGLVDGAGLLDTAHEVGARLLVPGDPGWPEWSLEPLDRPRGRRRDSSGGVPTALRPLGLWWRGPADPVSVLSRSVAVVGTRAPTAYGRAVTADLCAGVAAEGFTVISGGAFGIDAAAHRRCSVSGGTTIAVLAGSGPALSAWQRRDAPTRRRDRGRDLRNSPGHGGHPVPVPRSEQDHRRIDPGDCRGRGSSRRCTEYRGVGGCAGSACRCGPGQ